MSISTAVNSTSPNTIKWATTDQDVYERATQLAGLTENFDLHDHSSGKGLPAVRIGPAAAPVTITGSAPTAGQVLRALTATTAGWASVFAGSTLDVTTSETTTSTSFTDLATSGPAVTLSPGATVDHLILIRARLSSTSDAAFASVAIAGAAAADVDAIVHQSTALLQAGSHVYAADVASGSTHTMKYRVGGGTGTFLNRRISAVPMAT